jgi:hypothetical protein
MKKRLVALAVVGFQLADASAFAPNNFFDPYDPNLRLQAAPDTCLRIGANIEHGHTCDGRNIDSDKTNILQIYNETQSTIAMVMKPQKDVQDKLPFYLPNLTSWAGAPTDDGYRGRLKFTGEFEQLDITAHLNYLLPTDILSGDLSIGAYIPMRKADVKHVDFQNLTKAITEADLDLNKILNDKVGFKKLLRDASGLDIDSTSISGLGDVVLMLDWQNDYKQDKENLKNVTIFAKLGLSLPTGERRNEDKAFSVALGNDGAIGIPIGVGLGLDFVRSVRAGVDVDFLILLDESRTRRLKTEEHQTEFLLLSKGKATKDHGLTWKFNLYLQGYHFFRGLSAKVAYEYIKHDDDRLIAKSDDFNYTVINSAHNLQEWNTHNFIFQLSYDCFKEFKNVGIVPQFSFFYKLPVNGKGVINASTLGGQVGFNF